MKKKTIALVLILIFMTGGVVYAATMNGDEPVIAPGGVELEDTFFNRVFGKKYIEKNGELISAELEKNEKAQLKLFAEEKKELEKTTREAALKEGKKIGRKKGYDAGYKDGYAEKKHEKKIAEQKRQAEIARKKAEAQKAAQQKAAKSSPQPVNNNGKAPSKSGMRYIGNFHTTAYTSDPAENGGYNGTAMGTPIRRGVVAVDRNQIPLGTRLYIEGYGYARAEDVGGAITWNRLDLAVGSKQEAANWGRRNVNVYIVD